MVANSDNQIETISNEPSQNDDILRLAIEAAQLGIWDYNPVTGALIWSHRCRYFMGVSDDAEISYQLFLDLLHPDDRERTDAAINKAISNPNIYFREDFRVILPDNSIRWLHSSGKSVFDEKKGDAIRFIGTIGEITSQKLKEETILEQNRVLSIFNRIGKMPLDNLKVLMQTITDSCTELVGAQFGAFFYNVVNDEGESFKLYTLSGVPYEAFSKFPMPRKTEVFGPTFSGESIVRSDDITKDPRYGHNAPYFGIPDGHLPVKSFLSIPVKSIHGNVLGGLFFGHEEVAVFTPDREKLAVNFAVQSSAAIDNYYLINELNNSKTRFKLLADAMPQIVWVTDAKGLSEYFNKKWYEYTGLTEEESFIGGWQEILHPDDYELALLEFEECKKSKCKFNIEFRLLDKNGNYRWHLCRALPYLDERDEVTKWFGTATDIEEYKNLSGELERRVTERTEKLSETVVELERSNQDLEQFAYVASHDLKEPLRMISSYTNLLEKRYEHLMKPQDKEFIGFIVEGANRMGQLINDLLSFSRIGRTDISFKDVNLNEVLDLVKTDLANNYEKEINIQSDVLPSLRAVESNMLQLFRNILENAIKFNDRNEVQIDIKTKNLDKYWEISIADNGIGLDEKFADRIFTIFQRLHNREQYPGTGIGLAICKKIVEFHGGKIWIKSKPNEGTTFYFTLIK